ncbi:MAG: hypothetical protein WD071_14650 [Pseudohongiella sp.]|uniref:hypothetical protein n=1 Tax=Pseudohongiella sp. TaxID=1979412 RepID=UPI0034A0229E
MSTLEEQRQKLADLAEHKATRTNAFSRELPCDWNPYAIENPITGIPFTDESAWSLIAKLLRSDHKVNVVELKKPPGLEALELLYDVGPSVSFVYIKVHMGAKGKVIGRSFHYSTKGRER